MSCSTILILLGLSIDVLASLVLIFPHLNVEKSLDDDFIEKINKKRKTYTQKKHIKDRTLHIIGLILFAIGFIFQIIGVVLS